MARSYDASLSTFYKFRFLSIWDQSVTKRGKKNTEFLRCSEISYRTIVSAVYNLRVSLFL